jgi:hypothetical protein
VVHDHGTGETAAAGLLVDRTLTEMARMSWSDGKTPSDFSDETGATGFFVGRCH